MPFGWTSREIQLVMNLNKLLQIVSWNTNPNIQKFDILGNGNGIKLLGGTPNLSLALEENTYQITCLYRYRQQHQHLQPHQHGVYGQIREIKTIKRSNNLTLFYDLLRAFMTYKVFYIWYILLKSPNKKDSEMIFVD